MKCLESWLHEWVNPKLTRDQLAHTLTMAGLEVEEIVSVPGEKSEDYIIDLSITPNRGDCLSIKGVSREISALTMTPLKEVAISAVKSTSKDVLAVNIQDHASCPRYVGRVIKNVKANISSPTWLQNRLQHAGIRSINAIVDVMNYVMLEIGQPMHAFDLDKIDSGIIVRQSRQGEEISLLDESKKTLNADTLIIADKKSPLAIAGVMGGMDSGVTLLTKNIFLESAYFNPKTIARQRQFYNLHSDSSYRFERGIDPALQVQAIERATQLILDISGGEPGPVIEEKSDTFIPKEASIALTKAKLTKLLGIEITDKDIKSIFERLQFAAAETKEGWKITVPAYRSDISLPEDIVEEIARLYGYDNIPTHRIHAALEAREDGTSMDLQWLRQAFSDYGFHETISYSFIDKNQQVLFDPETPAKELVNPIAAGMEIMRTSLWPGLAANLIYNKSRQQERVRLFEIGICYLPNGKEVAHKPVMAGLIAGLNNEEQWGIPARAVDFYDLKGVIENILQIALADDSLEFKPDAHPALHPGQAAGIYLNSAKIGVLGALHPRILEALDLPRDPANRVFVFEMNLDVVQKRSRPAFKVISKFPDIRRDIAILVKQTVPAQVIQDTISSVAGDWLKDVFIFDVYQGKGVSPGLKSVAVGMIFQHPSRTLVDDEVTTLVNRIVQKLKEQLGAELRS